MKKIFFIIGIAAFSFATAQDNRKPGLKIGPPTLKSSPLPFPYNLETNTSLFPKTYGLTAAPPLSSQPKLSHILPNGDKVYSLPQDNMPCVVADISQFSMPVIMPDLKQYNMPNAANPPQNKIEPLTAEKLKELHDYLNKKSNK